MASYTDLLGAKYIAAAWNEAVNANAEDYLGSSLFGFQKQDELDLKWLKGSGGVPISLKPSAFDAEVALRGRIGAAKVETEMPLFREGIQISEKDRRALAEALKLGDEYVQNVMSRIFRDTNNLIRGAKVVPERMIWQLLAPTDGKPKISIAGDGINYAYNYDPNGKWFANNFVDCSSNPWSNTSTSDPIDQMDSVVKKAKANGSIIRYAIMSQNTMTEMRNSEKVRRIALSQNATANIYMTEKIVKDIIEATTGVRPFVYSEIYGEEKDGVKQTKPFFPDKVVSLLPEGPLGDMHYAKTSEEYELVGDPAKNVSIIDNSIAISTVCTSEMPPRIAIYASEIVLPSYERMDSVYEMKIDAD